MKEQATIIQFPVERTRPSQRPSEILAHYENLTHSHRFSEGNGLVTKRLDRADRPTQEIVAAQLGEEIFVGLVLIKAMGMDLQEVADIVKRERKNRGN